MYLTPDNGVRFCGGACRGPRVPRRIYSAWAEAWGPARSKRGLGCKFIAKLRKKYSEALAVIGREATLKDSRQAPQVIGHAFRWSKASRSTIRCSIKSEVGSELIRRLFRRISITGH